MNISGAAGSVLGAASGITNLANSLASRLGGTTGSYYDQLYPAQFRGVSFISLGGMSRFGRRIAMHEYPLRDTPWPEDIGRKTRRFEVNGYLVGEDVITQRDQLIAACEIQGAGTLIHATYGELQVSLDEVRIIERWDKARYFEIQFDFVVAGRQVYPTTSASTGSSVLTATTGVNVAAAADFATNALSTLAYGASIVQSAVSAAHGWCTAAKNVVVDAGNLFQILTDLPGDFGRFVGASTIPTFSTTTTTVDTTATVDSLTAAFVTNRVAVDTASSSLSSAAASLSTSNASDFSDAATNVVSAVLAAIPNPADGIRLLSNLATYSPSAVNTTSVIGTAKSTMQGACGDLFRRAVLAAIAQASMSYSPSSSDDAATVRDEITALIDAEVTIAGDQGEDETLQAMLTLRAAIVEDLNARGALLASIKTFNFKASLPSVVLAKRIYRDSSRADELVELSGAIHPLFMPTTFKALSQ